MTIPSSIHPERSAMFSLATNHRCSGSWHRGTACTRVFHRGKQLEEKRAQQRFSRRTARRSDNARVKNNTLTSKFLPLVFSSLTRENILYRGILGPWIRESFMHPVWSVFSSRLLLHKLLVLVIFNDGHHRARTCSAVKRSSIPA